MQVIASVFAATAALKSVAWPYVEKRLFATPAVILHNANIIDAQQGRGARLVVEVSKLRPCTPKTSTVYFVDEMGGAFSVLTGWNSSLPVATKLLPTFTVDVPAFTATGKVTSARLIVWHHDCQDGPDPQDAAEVAIQPFTISKGKTSEP
jgi:hypothetical protein